MLLVTTGLESSFILEEEHCSRHKAKLRGVQHRATLKSLIASKTAGLSIER